MPQNPLNFIAKNPSGNSVFLSTDADGALLVTAPDSPLVAVRQAHFDITAATTVKTSPGTLLKVNVLVVGTTTGTMNDCATTGAVALANEIAAIPEAVGSYEMDWPCATGITVVPGTGQTLTVLFA